MFFYIKQLFLLFVVVLATQSKAFAYDRFDYFTPILPIEKSVSEIAPEKLQKLSISEIEAEMGRKLSFKEKVVIKAAQKKYKKAQKSEKGTEGKTYKQLVAFLLCFFVGVIGIHRFYLGHIGIGIAQILTLGGCGIWTLIDFIRIITLDLKAKDGSEMEPW
jgi:hypothetical protein